MSVDYCILKVDKDRYVSWCAEFSASELEDEQYEEAMDARMAFCTELNSDLYPEEFHSHIACIVEEIVKVIHRGVEVRQQVPSRSLIGRLLGRTEEITEVEKSTDPGVTAFPEFAQLIYWSQLDDVPQTNDLNLQWEQIELSMDQESLERALKSVNNTNAEALTTFCKDHEIELDQLNDIVEGGLSVFVDRWRTVLRECIDQQKALVIEVYG